MNVSLDIDSSSSRSSTEPLCPVFGTCGGCAYQDIHYEDELQIKQGTLEVLFAEKLGVAKEVFDPIVPSPEPYHYRNRLDLSLLKSRKTGEVFMGFHAEDHFRIVPIAACPIARREISDFLPQLKIEAEASLPPGYRIANLTVRAGTDGRVRWGGIGKRSLRLAESDYFWIEIEGRKIFYSLDTFFQANLSILPFLIARMRAMLELDRRTMLLDLYGGVGFFGFALAGEANRIVLVEDNAAAVRLARYNAVWSSAARALGRTAPRGRRGLKHLGIGPVEIRKGRVEDELPQIFSAEGNFRMSAVINPPRRGLSVSALKVLSKEGAQKLERILYLSCHPDSLSRDLLFFKNEGWEIARVSPFDFFPKTKHIETLVLLKTPHTA